MDDRFSKPVEDSGEGDRVHYLKSRFSALSVRNPAATPATTPTIPPTKATAFAIWKKLPTRKVSASTKPKAFRPTM
jgi:hypothetical protein